MDSRLAEPCALHHNLVDAEKYRAAVFVVIEGVFEVFKTLSEHERAEFSPRRGHKFRFHEREERRDRPLHALERNVARKAVRHHHVVIAAHDVARLYVADELDVFERFKLRKRLVIELGCPFYPPYRWKEEQLSAFSPPAPLSRIRRPSRQTARG